MRLKRTIKTYHSNPNRDTQYDAALRAHLAATQEGTGRTYSQIARDLGRGLSPLRDPSTDKPYGLAVMWALQEFVADDARTISWFPHLRLPEAALSKKLEKSKHAGHDLRLYKNAPERKMIDRDPGRMNEVVGGLIVGYLKAEGPHSGHAVLLAMTMRLGHIDKRVVRRGLASLVERGDLLAEKVGLKNATIYAFVGLKAPPASVVPLEATQLSHGCRKDVWDN